MVSLSVTIVGISRICFSTVLLVQIRIDPLFSMAWILFSSLHSCCFTTNNLDPLVCRILDSTLLSRSVLRHMLEFPCAFDECSCLCLPLGCISFYSTDTHTHTTIEKKRQKPGWKPNKSLRRNTIRGCYSHCMLLQSKFLIWTRFYPYFTIVLSYKNPFL